MPKAKVSPPTAEKDNAQQDQIAEMTTTTKTSLSALRAVIESNDAGTSRRLVAYRTTDWNPQVDLSLTDLVQARAGLNAIARFLAGDWNGNAHLLFSAPTEKLGYENGTGTMAYVHANFTAADSFTVDETDEDGNTVQRFVTVDPAMVPANGFRRLHLDAGRLYPKAWETEILPENEDPGLYWHLRTVQALLGGRNISISLGPKTMDDAEAVLEVINSTDVKAANDTRLFANRERGRTIRQTRATTELFTAENVSVEDSDLEVSLRGGGTVSLKLFVPSGTVPVVTAAGIALKPLPIVDVSPQGLKALALTINGKGFKVISA